MDLVKALRGMTPDKALSEIPAIGTINARIRRCRRMDTIDKWEQKVTDLGNYGAGLMTIVRSKVHA